MHRGSRVTFCPRPRLKKKFFFPWSEIRTKKKFFFFFFFFLTNLNHDFQQQKKKSRFNVVSNFCWKTTTLRIFSRILRLTTKKKWLEQCIWRARLLVVCWNSRVGMTVKWAWSRLNGCRICPQQLRENLLFRWSCTNASGHYPQQNGVTDSIVSHQSCSSEVGI